LTRAARPATIPHYTGPNLLAIVAIIPARFGSTRLPGKPLSDILGKPMIQHVYERASRARSIDRLLVATDDERVAAAVAGFGGEVRMTSPAHASGTDRLAEVVRTIDAEIVVNVQGDEPLLDPEAIDTAVAAITGDPAVTLATLSLPLTDLEEMLSPGVVKVVVDGRGDALYFSRSPIPCVRSASGGLREAAWAAVDQGLARKHVGLYVYRRLALERFAALPPAPLELAEGLEQLRALHHGMRIRVAPLHASTEGVAVDTPEDLERVRALMGALAH
jgi:3-deoxy-manno-octulosonate cytidylyltransferase (CMP-KDO synthetase)